MEIRNKMRESQSTVLDPAILIPAIGQAFVKLDPRLMIKNPVMFVVEIVAALTTVIFLRDLVTGGGHLGFTFQIILWLWLTVLFANFAEAVAEGRGKAQAATLRKARTETHGQAARLRPNAAQLSDGAGARPEAGRHRAGRGRRPDPERRRGDRRHRLGRRVGDHRRIRAGDPRERRRPFGRHRRHARAVRLDQGAHHRDAGLHLPRSHDRAGGRRRAAEDAERDRAEHPARRPDDHLRHRRRHHPELRHLRRRRRSRW